MSETFSVIRRCVDCNEVCEPGCNCDHITVDVFVDELTEGETAHFFAHGTAEQIAEIADYLGAPSTVPAPMSFAA